MRYQQWGIIIVVISFLGIMGIPFFAFSQGTKAELDALQQEISARQTKVKQIEASIEAYKKRIEEKRTESVSLSNQIALLDNKTAQVVLDISVIQEKLAVLTLQIQQLDLSIQDKEKTMIKQKAILSEFLRTLYQHEKKDIIEIMSAYNTFSDFYNQIQYVERIERDVGSSLQSLRIAKTEIEQKKQETEKRKETYVVLEQELFEKKKDLEEQAFAKSNLLADTQSSELQYKTLLTGLRGQYQQVENEIASIEKKVRQKLAEQQTIKQTPEDQTGLLSWPTPSRYITARFHDPSYPYRHVFEHNAIDIRAGQGTTIQAAASGYVARAKHCSLASCYSFVMIVHSGGLSTVYGHMSAIYVKEDQFVARGDAIGLSGGTPGTVGAGPFVTGPHLHFEVRKDGIPVNPISYLVKDY